MMNSLSRTRCNKAQALCRILIILMVATILSFTIGCNKGDFVSKTYKTLKSAHVVYDTTMKITAKMKVEGSLNNEQWDKISGAANKFRFSGRLVSKLMKTYMLKLKNDPNGSDTISSRRAIEDAVGVLIINYKELLTFTGQMGIINVPQLL